MVASAPDPKLYLDRPVPNFPSGSNFHVTLLPCQKGSLEMPSRLPEVSGIMATIASQCQVPIEEQERIGLILPPLTLYIRVQFLSPIPFSFGISGRLLSLNGRPNESAQTAQWIGGYSADPSISSPQTYTVEDFMTFAPTVVTVRPGRVFNKPGLNEAVQRIEAWDGDRLLAWCNIIHTIEHIQRP